MLRASLLIAVLIAATTVASGGCRSCDSGGYDYAPPVANCNCDACGTHRSGSAFYGPGSSCSSGGCACGGHGGGYMEGAPQEVPYGEVPEGYYEEP